LGEAKRNLYNRVNPPTASHGRDAGVRITLPNGKLALSLGWYDAYQEGLALPSTESTRPRWLAIFRPVR